MQYHVGLSTISYLYSVFNDDNPLSPIIKTYCLLYKAYLHRERPGNLCKMQSTWCNSVYATCSSLPRICLLPMSLVLNDPLLSCLYTCNFIGFVSSVQTNHLLLIGRNLYKLLLKTQMCMILNS